MFYRYPHKEEEIVIAFENGGLGDCIARLPIIPYILEKHPHVKILLFVPKYFESIAKRSLKEGKKLSIHTFEEVFTMNKGLPVKSFRLSDIYNNLSTHMTDHAFRVMCLTDVEDKYKNYLPIKTKDISIKRFNLPEKYIVICTGHTVKVREMLPETVNQISQYIINKGYAPVFLGKKETYAGPGMDKIIGEFSAEVDYSIGLDLRDQTTLLESTRIIAESSGIVGLDNGLLHIAGTTTVPIIGGFTTVNPIHRMPYRNNVLGYNFYPVVLTQEELACNFCQSNMTFLIRHDFRNCPYGDIQCVKKLTAEKYINQLEKILI